MRPIGVGTLGAGPISEPHAITYPCGADATTIAVRLDEISD